MAGSKEEVIRLLLTEAAAEMAPLVAAFLSAASPAPLEKAEKYSPAALVGDAKGLSGRLCSKLHPCNKAEEK